MTSRHTSLDFPPFYEKIDKRDIRNTFRLPRLDDPMMLDKNISSSDWPPKFPAHEGYDPSFPVWGGYHKGPMTVQTFTDEDLASDASSEGSAGSSGSGGRSKFTRGPRIHHIPILVEARDDNSSGYSSDTPEERKTVQHSKSRTFQSDSAPSQNNHGRSIPITIESKKYNSPVNHNYSQLPGQYMNGQPQTQRSNSDQQVRDPRGYDHDPRTKKSWSHPPSSPPAHDNKPMSGPFLTKVRMNAPTPLVEGQSAVSAPINENKKAKKTKPNPKDQIKSILNEMEEYRKQVEAFQGVTKDKGYRYLDEMLTRLMLKLDDVDTEGMDDVRLERKNAVKSIQLCISQLENRITENEAAAKQEQMTQSQSVDQEESKPETELQHLSDKAEDDPDGTNI